MFDTRDPAVQALVEKRFPDIQKGRMAMVEEQLELQRKLAELRINGYPQNEEQMKFLYHLDNGDIKVPTAPAWQWEKWYSTDQLGASGWQGGLFSVRQWIKSAQPAKDPLERYDAMNPESHGEWSAANSLFPKGDFGKRLPSSPFGQVPRGSWGA